MDHDPVVLKYAAAAARLLEPSTSEPTAWPAELGERKQAVQAVEAALRQSARRRARRRWMAGAAAAAAAAAVVVGAVFFGATGADSVTVRVENGGLLEAGSLVEADPDREVRLSLSTGSLLHLRAGGRLALGAVGKSQRLTLRAGRLWARVSPLAPGHRFVVATADAEVEVHGTSFEVAVVPARADCDGAATEVRVFEGVVRVKRSGRQWRIAAGERWPADCRPAAQPAPQPGHTSRALPAAPPRARARTSPNAGPPRVIATAPEPAPSSTLAEQNDLFAAAMDARRRGDLEETRRRLDEMLARFPFGALAESARAERAKLPPRRMSGQRP
jgi:ferric-dicitrate binding protein FerR (iron transport regulator)